mgnify:CR=1 FL=1
MPTTIPSLLRYPSSTDTPNVPRDVQRLAEDTELGLAQYAAVPYFGKPYVFSGGSIGNPGGLFASITAGIAVINGWRFAFAAPANLALAASTTNHIWLKSTVVSGRHTGHTWVVKQTTAVEADAVYVGEVVTGAAAQTTRTDSFRGILHPGRVLYRGVLSNDIASGTGDRLTLPFVSDGVTPLAFLGQMHINPNAVAAGQNVFARIRDGAGGTGAQLAAAMATVATAGYAMQLKPESLNPVTPAVGSRNAYLHLGTSSGTASISDGSLLLERWIKIVADF